MPRIIKRAKDTLTAVEMDCGEVLEFVPASGEPVEIELVSTDAGLMRTTLKELKKEAAGGRTDIRFACVVRINGAERRLEREISTPKSFYEPWEVEGVRLWFDAVQDIFKFLNEAHGPCRPAKHARFAIQEAGSRICPEKVHPWCPIPEGGIKIEDCYRGEDCWLGAYNGASAHGGLDINHPDGTPLRAPINIDDQFYFNSLKLGHKNNRWRGIRRWDNGSAWILQVSHVTELLVPERVPISAGGQFAVGAGVATGAVEHSHFVFKIFDDGELILIDPWILFWQMQKDSASAGKSAPGSEAR